MTRNRLGSLGLAGCALLIALVTIAPPLRSSQPRHLHQAVTDGLYNQEHLLAGLEFLGGDAPVPDAPPAVFTALVMVPCAPPPHRVHDGPPGSLADSRAPPALA